MGLFKSFKKMLAPIGGAVGFALGGPMGAALGSGIGSLAGGGDVEHRLRENKLGDNQGGQSGNRTGAGYRGGSRAPVGDILRDSGANNSPTSAPCEIRTAMTTAKNPLLCQSAISR